MKFIIEEGMPDTQIALFYKKEYYGFDISEIHPDGITSLLVNDVSLEIDPDGRILYVWGLCPYTAWKSAELSAPVCKVGILRVIPDQEILPGVSIVLGKQYTWVEYYDLKSGWICIGDKDKKEGCEAVEFCKDCIAVIEDGKLVALWLHPEFVD